MTEPASETKPARYSAEWIREVIGYHQPDEVAMIRIGNIRQAAGDFIEEIIRSCPDCADRVAAIRLAREAMMTANASIVLKGLV